MRLLTKQQALTQAASCFDRRIRVGVDDHGVRTAARPGAEHCKPCVSSVVWRGPDRWCMGWVGVRRPDADVTSHSPAVLHTSIIMCAGTRRDRAVGDIEDQVRAAAEVLHRLTGCCSALQLLQSPG